MTFAMDVTKTRRYIQHGGKFKNGEKSGIINIYYFFMKLNGVQDFDHGFLNLQNSNFQINIQLF